MIFRIFGLLISRQYNPIRLGLYILYKVPAELMLPFNKHRDPHCQDPLVDLSISFSSHGFSKAFLPICHPSLSLNTERHPKYTIDVE